tara:strand:- start:206341 stop:206814 length:474 start_codon:yes stop_codon:yes gene_type:complete
MDYCDDPIDVFVHSQEQLETLVPAMSYKRAVNVVHQCLVEALKLDDLGMAIGNVFVGDSPAPAYRSVIVPSRFRYKKAAGTENSSSTDPFHACACGRQLGGSVDWRFQLPDGVNPQVISIDIGAGIFVTEAMLDQLSSHILNQLALYPRRISSSNSI